MIVPGRECANPCCDKTVASTNPRRLTCSDACRQAVSRRKANRDALLRESARMGIVERTEDGWRLTRRADLEYGAAFRGLPAAIRAEVAA